MPKAKNIRFCGFEYARVGDVARAAFLGVEFYTRIAKARWLFGVRYGR